MKKSPELFDTTKVNLSLNFKLQVNDSAKQIIKTKILKDLEIIRDSIPYPGECDPIILRVIDSVAADCPEIVDIKPVNMDTLGVTVNATVRDGEIKLDVAPDLVKIIEPEKGRFWNRLWWAVTGLVAGFIFGTIYWKLLNK